jgi:colanic acid/amylovoran biosynthesis glycosyltransferase
VVPKRSPAALATTIAHVIEMSANERHSIIIAAQHRIKNEFTVESQIEKFDKFYSNA